MEKVIDIDDFCIEVFILTFYKTKKSGLKTLIFM